MKFSKINDGKTIAGPETNEKEPYYVSYSFSSILFRNKDIAADSARNICLDNELLFSWNTYLLRLRDLFPGRLSCSCLCKATFDSVSIYD